MGQLEKLTIKVEQAKSVFSFGDAFTALFNPDKLIFSKSANWAKENPKSKNCPELQFTNAEPRTLKLDLIFDTFDPEEAKARNKDQDVRKLYTDKVFRLITAEEHEKPPKDKRPPVCRLFWGYGGCFFQGVLQQLEQQFTLFTEKGIPVRAKLSCTFKEWPTDYTKIQPVTGQSSDISEVHMVKRGDTLSSIAAEKCLDPKSWRPIAKENGIDDPRALTPGTLLLLPASPGRSR